MPNIKSAKKRMELGRRARERNRAKRSRIRTAVKSVREATDPAEAEARFREAAALLDRAVTKHLIPSNRVARIKSGLNRHMNGL